MLALRTKSVYNNTVSLTNKSVTTMYKQHSVYVYY